MTRFNPDDPKWTAYVLGELDETERAAVELELDSSNEARMLVEELRFAAELTKAELRDGIAVAPLTSQQRETVRLSATPHRPRRWFNPRPAVWAAGLAAASLAVIVLTVTVEPVLLRPQIGPPESTPIAEAKVNHAEEPAPHAASDSAKPVREFELRKERSPAPPVPPTVQVTANPLALNTSSASLAGAAAEAGRGGGAGLGGVVTGRLDQQDHQANQDLQVQQSQAQIAQQAFAASPSSGPSASSRAPAAPEFDRIRSSVRKSAEAYNAINDSPFLSVAQNPTSTFSIDLDSASYSNVRRYLNQNQLPPKDAVRIEEMINYFTYDYPQPAGDDPIGATIEAAPAPWSPQHRLVRIGIKHTDADARRRPSSVARDVKAQVEFNPAVIDSYRLIGYENGALRNADFTDGLKDARDMSAGHTVTVLYEVVPAPRAASTETLTLKIRYNEPTGRESKLLVFPLVDRGQTFAGSSVDFRFAAAVASFGMILRDSPYKGTATIDSVLSIAEGSLGSDRSGDRREFLQLLQHARQIRGQ